MIVEPPTKFYSGPSTIVMGLVGLASKVFLNLCSRAQIHRAEVLREVLENRKPGQPLITVCNHMSCLDDPLLWGSLPLRTLWHNTKMRWTLAAKEICFTNEVTSWFFTMGKTLPIVRGKGVRQVGMDQAIEKLNSGDWIHIFPEARVNQTHRMLPLRWGIGELVMKSKIPPLVLLLWHDGFQEVLPEKRIYIPRVGKKIDIMIDKVPLQFDGLLEHHRAIESNQEAIRAHITEVVEMHMLRLQRELLGAKLHNEHHTHWNHIDAKIQLLSAPTSTATSVHPGTRKETLLTPSLLSTSTAASSLSSATSSIADISNSNAKAAKQLLENYSSAVNRSFPKHTSQQLINSNS